MIGVEIWKMNKKGRIKSISGFVIANLIFFIFAYFLFNHFNFSYWLLIILFYLFLLAISLLIFSVWLDIQRILVPFVPLFPLVILASIDMQKIIRKNLVKEGVKQNVHSRTVVLATNFKWYEIDYYLNTSPTHNDVKELVKYLVQSKKDFSFYLKPSRKDIEDVMSDKKVREVYFLGHGNSWKFQINTMDLLKYKEFDDKKYYKDFVHQVHCGTKYGKPLRCYVVPKKNWKKCFFVREKIAEKYIVEYFRNKTLSLKK